MDYQRIVELIAVEKLNVVSDKLVDLILTSKNDEKMPSRLAGNLLHHWQMDILRGEAGLTLLLEAALLLETDKTLNAFSELQMGNVADQIKAALES